MNSVLIVDDNKDLLGLLASILSRAGYPARGWSAFGGKTGTVADDGETALKKIAIMEV